MPRNSQGLYTLPAGNPVISGTLIESAWANGTMDDVATALTQSLPRDGSAPMTGPLTLESNPPTQARHATSKAYVDQFVAYASGLPIGSIITYGGSSAPAGFLLCNGQAVSRTTYAELFALWGTTYGAGDGTTTFNLLDMRDKSPMGAGTSVPLNDQQGQFARTILDANMPVHSHTLKANNAIAKTLAGGTGQFAIAAVSTGSTTDAQSGTAGNATPLPILHPVKGLHVVVWTGVL